MGPLSFFLPFSRGFPTDLSSDKATLRKTLRFSGAWPKLARQASSVYDAIVDGNSYALQRAIVDAAHANQPALLHLPGGVAHKVAGHPPHGAAIELIDLRAKPVGFFLQ